MASRIMIVEDEHAIANLIAINLRATGMEPVIFYDGDSAVKSLYEDHNYSLALLDIMLPNKNGFEVFEHIKPYGIPVIFLTAKDDINSKINGLQGGAEDYIVKPFEMLELIVRIEKVLQRTNEKNDSIIKTCGLEIRVSEHRVMKGNEEIFLKPKEFDLLVILAKYRNIAVTREDLLCMVWGTNYLGESRTVDVHIGQLRKKLGLQNQIVTIPKTGYRLEDKNETKC